MWKVKRPYIPVLALGVGFANALLAFQYNNLLFCLIPLWAFAFGYFSSSRLGLLSAFLLFMSYTATLSLMARGHFEPIDYIYNFALGGFALLIVGYGAPLVKRTFRSPESIVTMISLVLLLAWCGFLSFPRWKNSYYYQVIVTSPENIRDLELYIPLVAAAGKPYTELFDHPLPLPAFVTYTTLTEDYILEVVDTEYGRMAKFVIRELREEYRPPPLPSPTAPTPLATPTVIPWPSPPAHVYYPYDANIIFDMSWGPSLGSLEFLPKQSVNKGTLLQSERYLGWIRVESFEIVEKFKVPLKVSAAKEGEVAIRLETWSSTGSRINFTISKGQLYKETCNFQTIRINEWSFVDGEASRSGSLSAAGD